MELNPLLITTLFDIAVLCLCTFTILSLLAKKRKDAFWAIIFLVGFLMHALGKLTGPPVFGLLNTRFINTPAWHFIIPPALYLYVSTVLGYTKKDRPILHFLPFLIFFILFLFLPPPPPTIVQVARVPLRTEGPMKIGQIIGRLNILAIISVLFGYLFATFNLLKKHAKQYKHYYAQTDSYTSLSWVKWILVIFLIGSLLIVFTKIGIKKAPHHLLSANWWVIALSSFCIVSVFCFFILNQFILFENSQTLDNINQPLEKVPPISISTKKELLIKKLEEYMLEKKPYLQPKIKIADLATELSEKPHHLSKLINEHYGYNFFYFINHYRIEHATKLLMKNESQQFTLEGIGQQSGFNSRATFNARFKEIKGISPGAFRKKYS